ncbi:MAG: GNAT family N-acetyltransferase [Lentisphaerae bacterium]|nr:GNAT family N-acetyltransferase [Lentisphaerota bacterium]
MASDFMIGFHPVQTDKDIAMVAKLAREIWRKHYNSIIGDKQVEYMLEKFQSEAAISDQIANGYQYYLIRNGDSSIGYLAVILQMQESPQRMMVSKIYVVQNYRGIGCGKAAIRFAEKLCVQSGAKMLWLTVNKYNSNTINWYEHMGFVNARSVVQNIGAGFIMDDYVMEKVIVADKE